MRLNKFLALHTSLSRRAADREIEKGTINLNGKLATLGDNVSDADNVTWGDKTIKATTEFVTILLYKPIGYVCSREGQGSKPIYDLLPSEFHNLNPVGRLDKDSSGLLLMTNDGALANELTHPSRQKNKVYEVTLKKPLQPLHQQMISDYGIQLEDGPSQLMIQKGDDARDLTITMHEGRNRQIRRTFESLGYEVIALHRTQFGSHTLPNQLQPGDFTNL